MATTLTVAGGPQDGQSVLITPGESRSLGGAPDCALRLTLGNVAPQHARLSFDAARGLLLSDLGSATGTYVNGEKIGADHVLADGDRVCLGPPGSKQTAKLVVGLRDDSAADTAGEPALILDAPTEVPLALDGPMLEADPEPAILVDEVPPPVAAPKVATPLPPPTAAKPAAAKAAAVKPAADTKKPARAEYTNELPSIAAPGGPRAAGAPLPVPMPLPVPDALKKAKRLALPAIPRPLLAVGIGLLLSAVAYFGWRSFQAAPPVITAVLPPKAEAGQTVSLQGSGFGSNQQGVTVRFAEQVGQIISATETQVAVTLPQIAPSGGAADFPVTIENRAGRSNAIFLTISAPPRITSFSPDVAMPGELVSATGKNLDAKPLSVLVSGQLAEILDAKPTSLRFRVPELPVIPGEAAQVVITAGRESSKSTPLYLGRLPLLIEARPIKARPGERVTLRGRGFDANLANLEVRFGGEPSLVISATENEIVASVPGSGVMTSQLDADVIVSVSGSRSNPAPFILTRPSSGYFTPHYFPAPVPDRPGYALVSTDIGPVLALGGRAEAASTAERAVRAAAALNAMVEEAQKKPVSLELRDKPVLGIALAGHPELLLAVTPDDLAAYEVFDPTLRTRRVSQRSVAAFWSALLQDQLALFVTRERPFRVVEITPRGRALMQIYSEALRRAGAGAGVPVGVVSPLPSNLGRDLREMALLLPAEGQSSAAAAIEGRWIGTMWEEGQGDKNIAIRLRLEGSRLAGFLTTSAGAIRADVPLENVSYDKGALRFTLSVGGVRRQFQGQVQGASVSGEIVAAGGGAKGRFTLKYAE